MNVAELSHDGGTSVEGVFPHGAPPVYINQ